MDIDAEAVLVLTSDPITFATDAIGEYAVMVNANDVATSGATVLLSRCPCVGCWLRPRLQNPHPPLVLSSGGRVHAAQGLAEALKVNGFVAVGMSRLLEASSLVRERKPL